MKEKQAHGFIESNFDLYIEPEEGINSTRDFTSELLAWAKKENRDITINEESMEPLITLDGEKYICKLGDVNATVAKNLISKALKLKGLNRVGGPYLGYKWIYLYKKK